jgi:hypothetical protein
VTPLTATGYEAVYVIAVLFIAFTSWLLGHDLGSWTSREILAAAPPWIARWIYWLPCWVRLILHRVATVTICYGYIATCLFKAAYAWHYNSGLSLNPVGLTDILPIGPVFLFCVFYALWRPLQHNKKTGYSPTRLAVMFAHESPEKETRQRQLV